MSDSFYYRRRLPHYQPPESDFFYHDPFGRIISQISHIGTKEKIRRSGKKPLKIFLNQKKQKTLKIKGKNILVNSTSCWMQNRPGQCG